jgi:hypothetical protein
MKQTAVEWLIDQLDIDLIDRYWIIEKAKEMEKKQIIEAAQWMTPAYADAELYYEHNYKNTKP